VSTALQTQPRPGSLVPSDLQWGMTRDQLELVKRTIAKDTTDDEFALFMTVAHRRGLDPFDRQIHAVKRWDPDAERKVMAIQIGIDGYRLGATRTGEENGQDGPYWCGADGIWVDVWLHDVAPAAAKVTVYRKGRDRGYTGIALWASYVQTKKDGTPNSMWRRHGPGQLAKCAEALAIRKAFPQELGGTHTDDELGVDAIDVEFRAVETAQPVVQPRAPAAVAPAAPAHGAERKAAEDAAREDALAKARAAAAELEQSRRAAPPPADPPADTARAPAPPAATVTLSDDDLQSFVHDMYKARHLGALKTVALAVSKRKATPEQRVQLAKVYEACEKTLAAKAGAPAQGAA
jgi:phage recombination protein Bet